MVSSFLSFWIHVRLAYLYIQYNCYISSTVCRYIFGQPVLGFVDGSVCLKDPSSRSLLFAGSFINGVAVVLVVWINSLPNEDGYCTLIVSTTHILFVFNLNSILISRLFEYFNTFIIHFLNSLLVVAKQLMSLKSCWLWQILNISKWCEIGDQWS